MIKADCCKIRAYIWYIMVRLFGTNSAKKGNLQGKKSWLNGLTGTKWYLHSNLNGDFVVIDFSEQYKDKDFNMCMAYQLF